MFLFTNYSVFFVTELKHRFYFITFSFFLLIVYIGAYLNFFLIDVLEPIEYLSLDWNASFMYKYVFQFICNMNSDILLWSEDSIVVNTYTDLNNTSDYYPVFEINVSESSYLYFYLLCYLSTSFITPVLLYHVYLFLAPGLFSYELVNIQFYMYSFVTAYLLFIFFIKKYILFLLLHFTYNTYYEFLNYEFDFVFDICNYIMCSTYSTLLFITYYFLCISIRSKNNLFLLFFFSINFLFYYSFFLNALFFFFFSFFFYISLLFSNM